MKSEEAGREENLDGLEAGQNALSRDIEVALELRKNLENALIRQPRESSFLNDIHGMTMLVL